MQKLFEELEIHFREEQEKTKLEVRIPIGIQPGTLEKKYINIRFCEHPFYVVSKHNQTTYYSISFKSVYNIHM